MRTLVGVLALAACGSDARRVQPTARAPEQTPPENRNLMKDIASHLLVNDAAAKAFQVPLGKAAAPSQKKSRSAQPPRVGSLRMTEDDGLNDIQEWFYTKFGWDKGGLDGLFTESKEPSEEVASLFTEFDTNGDGYIQFNELEAALEKAGQKSKKTEDIFKRLDANNDGKISLEEFRVVFKEIMPTPKPKVAAVRKPPEAQYLPPNWRKKSGAAGTFDQDFLEFEPYYDMKTMPNNLYKNKDPFIGTIQSVKKITGPRSTGETFDIVISHGGSMPYIEGQSYGVIPPGRDAKGKPNKVRLYSIASSRYGDDMTGDTTTLCVRRATYWCPELKAEDPAKKGVCSNYLCDAKAGDIVTLTGPTGKVMLLPEDKPETDIIMVATGTGIAPMRSFLRRMFAEKTPYANDFKGLAWLFLGVANTDGLLYDDEWKAIQKSHPDQFRYDVALSREQKKPEGIFRKIWRKIRRKPRGKMYIQDRVEQHANEIFERLDKGAHIYFCGLKGMMPGIQDMLQRVAKKKKLNYDEFIKKLKKNGQWHVEVY